MSRSDVRRFLLHFSLTKLILFVMFGLLLALFADLNQDATPIRSKEDYDRVKSSPVKTDQGQVTTQGQGQYSTVPVTTGLHNATTVTPYATLKARHKVLQRNPKQILPFSEMLQLVELREPSKAAQWNFSYSVKQSAIENFTVTLPPLLKNYHNPCWLEYLPPIHAYQNSFYYHHDCMEQPAVQRSFAWSYSTNYERRKKSNFYRVRCFPYFFVLGVAKSGTTDLYYSVTRYFKDVISGARKEPHFWNRRRIGIMKAASCQNEPGHRATVSDYLDLYDEAAEKIRLRVTKVQRVRHHNLVTGDFTPVMLTSSPGWMTYEGNAGRSEPLYTVAHHLYGVNPDAKLIIILRDPVERAFSHMRYRHLPRDGQVAAKFHSLVINTITDLQQCSNIRACVYNRMDSDGPNSAGNDIIVPGMYAIFIRDWLKVFPLEQFLFIRFEDYAKDRAAQLDRISTFLEISPMLPDDRAAVKGKNVSNAGTETEQMWPRTKAILQQFYQPWNAKLKEILTKEFSWGY